MILITAGDFISQEMRAEIGSIPPAFLPLGNRRLFEHQVDVLRQSFPDEAVLLSIPDSYPVGDADERRLSRLGVTVVPVKTGLSLGTSVTAVLEHVGVAGEGIRILHGDTLILDLPADASDCIAVSETTADAYGWAEEERRASHETVWSGYFAFSDAAALLKCLRNSEGRFVEAVQRYRDIRPTTLRRTDRWLDFGHVNTLFKSRTAFTTQRHFNQISVRDGIVTKRSSDRQKIIAEAEWFGALPPQIKVHAPQILDYRSDDDAYYALEYLPVFPLNELYVFGRLSALTWSGIFDRIADLLGRFRALAPGAEDPAATGIARDFEQLVRDKTFARLNAYAPSAPFALDAPVTMNGTTFPSIHAIAEECVRAALAGPARPGILHGDLCFSNMLYDARADRLKVIDPRGITVAGVRTVYGDMRYDVAKMTHSVLGMYDHIIGGYFEIVERGAGDYDFAILSSGDCDEVGRQFIQRRFADVAIAEVLPLTILLFVSMIPLHKDNRDRQLAFLLNALRLYELWRDN